ncbi:MAG: myo-inositol 2-dehydrogenase [Mesorhizobium sp.]|nr:MAG: myo-inositol 2-dehydrogenase [Mesorhizobium sp.]
MSIRLAIIGAGVMGAKLQVICDASLERARKVADDFGAVDVATDSLDTIRRSDVDAVLIASPDETHAPLSLAAIEAGKPALCEKPLSQSARECLDVIKTETSCGRQFVQLGFMRRFDPSYAEMKSALDDGALGRAIMMHNFHRNVEAPANFTGQMAITNSAPHEFDVARFVLGSDYRSISVFQPSVVDASKTGAPVFMVLETTTGQLVNIEINNNAAYGYDVRGELVGEKGSVFLNGPIHARYNLSMQSLERYATDWRPRFAEAYRLQNRAFLEFVRSGVFHAVAADAWDGYCAALVAEAGVEALATGGRVNVVLEAKPALYQRRMHR